MGCVAVPLLMTLASVPGAPVVVVPTVIVPVISDVPPEFVVACEPTPPDPPVGGADPFAPVAIIGLAAVAKFGAADEFSVASERVVGAPVDAAKKVAPTGSAGLVAASG